MPVLDLSTTGQFQTLNNPTQPQREDDPLFFAETLPALYQMENTVGSMSNVTLEGDGERDPEYDPSNIIPQGHEDYADQYFRTKNAHQGARLSQAINRELEAKDIIDRSGAMGVLGGIGVGVIDPINLIPGIGVGYKLIKGGGAVINSVARGAATGAMSMTATEAVLHGQQKTRTATESIINIAGGTILSGALAGGSKKLAQYISGERGINTNQAMKEMEEVTEQNFDLDVYDSSRKSMGSAEREISTGNIADEGIAGNWFVDNVLTPVYGWVDPVMRGSLQPLRDIRAITHTVAETPSLLQKNVTDVEAGDMGAPTQLSLERAIRDQDAYLYASLGKVDDMYSQYVQGRGKKMGDWARNSLTRMTQKDRQLKSPAEFREMVSQEVRNPGTTGNQFAKEAADTISGKYFDHFAQLAVDSGLFKSKPDTKTAMRYLTRMWDPEKLNDSDMREELRKIVIGALSSEQAKAVKRLKSVPKKEAALKRTIKARRAEVMATTKAIENTLPKVVQDEFEQAVASLSEALVTGRSVKLKTPHQMQVKAGKDAQAAANAARQAEISNVLKTSADDISKLFDDDFLNNMSDKLTDDIADFSRDDIIKLIAEATEGEMSPQMANKIATKIAAAQAGINATASATFKESFKKSMGSQRKALQKRIAAITSGGAPDIAAKEMEREIRREAKRAASKAIKKSIAQATETLRKEMDDALDELAAVRKGKIIDEFAASIQDQGLKDQADVFMNHIVSTPRGRIPYAAHEEMMPSAPKGMGPSGFLKRRSDLLQDADVEKFLVNDIDQILNAYHRSVVPDVTLSGNSMFEGDPTGAKLFDKAARIWHDYIRDFDKTYKQLKQLKDSGNREHFELLEDELGVSYKQMSKIADKPGRLQTLEKQRASSLEDIEAMVGQLRGTYGMPDNPADIVPRVGRALRQHSYVTKLGKMVASSLTDMGGLVMKNGYTRIYKDLVVDLMSNWKAINMSKSQLRELGVGLDMILNTKARAVANIQDDFLRSSKYERALGAVSDRFGLVTGMAAWNTIMKTSAGMLTMNRLDRALKGHVTGKITNRDATWLNHLGIDGGTARAIAAQIEKHGGKEGAQHLPNVSKWDSEYSFLSEIYRSALNKDVDSTIVTPGLDQPLWVKGKHGEFGKMAGQFDSFGFASVQRTLVRGAQEHDLAAVNGLWTMVSLGMMIYYVKTKEAGKEPSDDPRIWIREGVDRSGVTGWFFELDGAMSRLTHGTLSTDALVGGKPLSRMSIRNTAGALLGPSAGIINDTFSFSNGVFGHLTGQEDMSKSQVHAGRRLMWLQNLQWFEQGINAVEGSVNKSLGINTK
jgi:hypothetical protein